ncbi:hypothetical protein [Brevibacillus sp. H7]|uniref:hypothetical protein n=1 Tax=Brevibacillus sp. H7 TaxID=3349138 RepID=UPI0037F1B0BD
MEVAWIVIPIIALFLLLSLAYRKGDIRRRNDSGSEGGAYGYADRDDRRDSGSWWGDGGSGDGGGGDGGGGGGGGD